MPVKKAARNSQVGKMRRKYMGLPGLYPNPHNRKAMADKAPKPKPKIKKKK
jgi:hypothetical protein